ncbi:MAG: ABC transporter permease [Candidatus Marinimicrobia bacterium]|nr:ABC transporter permease [Candidatus Neomarinimicrobiota bacterium]
MRKILFIIQKEFLQISRNRAMLPIIFAVPLIQLVILVHAATFEIKNIDIAVVDNDLSMMSNKLTDKFNHSAFFQLRNIVSDVNEAKRQLEMNEVEVFINIPANFEKKMIAQQKVEISVVVDAVNSRNAGLISGYIKEIIENYNKEIFVSLVSDITQNKKPAKILTNKSYWYNTQLNYKNFMVPGILVILVTLIGVFLSAMNIVREKEIGTIEQLNVTPLGKFQFIIGKLVPFMVIGLLEFSIGLLIGKFAFQIPIVGSLFLLYGVLIIFLFTLLAVGFLISTLNNTQQQALLVAYFFMMLFLLMSGLFTPIDSIPEWARILNKINPVAYFLKINRMIILKGSVLTDIFKDVMSLFVLGIIILNLAVFRYKKTV